MTSARRNSKSLDPRAQTRLWTFPTRATCALFTDGSRPAMRPSAPTATASCATSTRKTAPPGRNLTATHFRTQSGKRCASSISFYKRRRSRVPHHQQMQKPPHQSHWRTEIQFAHAKNIIQTKRHPPTTLSTGLGNSSENTLD